MATNAGAPVVTIQQWSSAGVFFLLAFCALLRSVFAARPSTSGRSEERHSVGSGRGENTG
jgi:hypothetical protein